jgi:polysaccharide chain length determinant protein (PEP-CTERM system associated)
MLGHRSLEIADYLFIVKRRRWLLVSCALIFPAIAVVATRFLPPKYMSQTLVLIEEPKVSDAIVKPVVDSRLDSRLASMKEQILSRSRVQPIIERYHLYETSHMTMDGRLDQTRKSIDIKPIRSEITKNGGLPGFFITFTNSDAHTAQLVCGEITTLFLNENLRRREANVEGTTDFLKGQVGDAKRNLDEQDAKLATFKREHFNELPTDEASNMTMLNSMNTQLEAATQSLGRMEQEKTYQESMLAQIQPNAPPPRPSTPGSASPAGPVYGTPLQERELQALRERESAITLQYTPNHPDVIAVRRQISDLKKEIVRTAVTTVPGAAPAQFQTDPQDTIQVRQLRAQIHSSEVGISEKRREQSFIQGKLAQYQARLQLSPQVEEEYKNLTRDYATAQKFYDELQAKMNNSKMATDLERRQEGEQFRVMDEPNLPDSPSFPVVWQFGAVGLMVGLLVGGGIAAFKEYKDTSLRTERDVWAFTRLPTLAIISVAGEISHQKPNSSGLMAKIASRFRRRPTTKTDENSLTTLRG